MVPSWAEDAPSPKKSVSASGMPEAARFVATRIRGLGRCRCGEKELAPPPLPERDESELFSRLALAEPVVTTSSTRKLCFSGPGLPQNAARLRDAALSASRFQPGGGQKTQHCVNCCLEQEVSLDVL